MKFPLSFATSLFLPCLLLSVLMGPLVPRAAAAPGDVDTALSVPIVGAQVYGTAEQPDGKLIIVGNFTSVLGVTRNNIARLNADGTLDTGFNPNASGAVYSVVLLPDGKILIGGAFGGLQPPGATQPVERSRLARLNADGTVDLDFNLSLSGSVFCLALQPDGKIWFGGTFFNITLPDESSYYRPRLARMNADGSLDLSMSDLNVSGTVYSVAVQPDGKILVGGSFSNILGMTRPRLARLNADLTLDAAFYPAPNGIVYTVVLQADGKVVAGGAFTTLQPNGAATATTRNRLARVNADGTLDTSFDPAANGNVTSLALQADGRVLVGGAFTTLGSTPRSYLARLDTTGAVDTGFASNATAVVNSVVVQPNGKVLVSGAGGYLARLLNDPATQSLTIVDASRVSWARGGAAPEVASATLDLSVDSGGTWTRLGAAVRVSGGWAMGDLSLPAAGILRMRGVNRGGIYSSSCIVVEQSLPFSALAPVPVEIVVQGSGITISNGDLQPAAADGTDFGPMLAAGAGTVTHAFTVRNTGSSSLTLTGTPAVAISGAHAADFTVLAQPAATVAASGSATFQIRFDPSARGLRTATVSIASNDPDENPHVFAIQGLGSALSDPDPVDVFQETTEVYAIAEQPDGKVLLGGKFSTVLGVPRKNIARLNADGTLDVGFDPSPNSPVYCIVVQPDGKVLLGGEFFSLQPNGAATAIPRGRIARVNGNGTLDMGFDPNVGDGAIYAMTQQPDGKVIAGGYFTYLHPNGTPDTAYRNHVARFNPDGTLDGGFNITGMDSSVYSVVVQPDGKVLMGGGFSTVLDTPRRNMARLNANGTLDAGFYPAPNNFVSCMALQPDGKVLIGGPFFQLSPNGSATPVSRGGLARLNSDGSVDSSYDAGIGNSYAQTLSLQADGRLLIGGSFTAIKPNATTTTVPRRNLVRLNGDGSVDSSFETGASGAVYGIAIRSDGRVLLGGSFTGITNDIGIQVSRKGYAQVYNNSASQTLSAVNVGRVAWTRGGSAPQFSNVSFELSVDSGVTWTSLGAGRTAAGGGWEATQLSLPPAGLLRARGRVFGGFGGGGGGLIEQVAVFTDPPPAPLAPPEMAVQGNGNTIATGSTAPSIASHTDFGSVYIAGPALVRTFTVLNTGPSAGIKLLLNGAPQVAISGTHAADFTVTAQPVATVVGGQSTTFQITFQPSATGLRTATVSIATNDPERNPYVFAIQGTGTAVVVPPVVTSAYSSYPVLSAGGWVDCVAEQPDGKVILGGNFSSVLGVARSNLARLNVDGTLDTTFDPSPNAGVYSIVVQADGKIVVGGLFQTFQPNGAATQTSRQHLARLNADGTLDAGFYPSPGYHVYCVVAQPDGKLLIGGVFTSLAPGGDSSVSVARLARITAQGEVDATFSASANGAVYSIAVQPDGKILASGQFGQINGTERLRIARMNADGSLDTAFAPGTDAQVTCVALQVDGKVLLGGKFGEVKSSGSTAWTQRTYLARLNADGTLDNGFNVGLNEQISGMAVQADGKIMLSGYFDTVQPQGAASAAARQRMVRLKGDGTLDGSFTAEASYTIYSMGLRSDGTALIGGPFPSITVGGSTITRQGFTSVPSTPATQTLTETGGTNITWLRDGSAPEVRDVGFEVSVDSGTSWTSLGAATRVAGGWQKTGLSLPSTGMLRARGRTPGGFAAGSGLLQQVAVFGTALWTPEIAVQGNATSIETGDTTPGAADHSHFGEGTVGGASPVVRTFTIQNTGAGALELAGTPRVALTGLNTADFTVTEQPAATVPAGGSTTFKIAFSPFSTGLRTATVRIVNNDADETPYLFAIQGRVSVIGDADALNPLIVGTQVNATVQQLDGKLIIAGSFTSVRGVARSNIARLNADGSLDAGFDPRTNGMVNSVVVQPDGRILIGGSFTTLQPNGAAATTLRNRIARLNTDGTLDLGFDPWASSTVNSIALQPDGRIWVGGTFTTFRPNNLSPVSRSRLARLNVDGTVDSSFGNPVVGGTVSCMARQADGKLLLGGTFNGILGAARSRLARLNKDGTLDAAFNGGANDAILSLLALPDGKVLIGGRFTSILNAGGTVTAQRTRLARLNADGSVDADFDSAVDNDVNSMTLQGDGSVVLGGAFTQVGGVARSFLARVGSNGVVDNSFDPHPAGGVVNSVALQSDGRVLVGGKFTSLQNAGGAASTNQYLARLINGSAVRQITVVNSSEVIWTLGGTAPNVSEVSLDLSADNGATWTALGAVQRLAGVWHWGDLSLPAAGSLRARGRTLGGFYSSSAPAEQVVAFSNLAPVAVDIVLQGNGVTIAVGDMEPGLGDHTDIGRVYTAGVGTVARTFTIRDTGTASLALNGTPKVVLGGAHAADFSITMQPAATVPAGGSTSFQITLDPSAPGLRTATVSIASNDPDENPHVFAIQGRGLVTGDVDNLDINITTSNDVNGTVVQPDGKLVIVGSFSSMLGVPRHNVARLNADGTLDLGFDPNTNGRVNSVIVQPDGKILLGGGFSSLQPNGAVSAIPRGGIARVNADGALDVSFNPNANSEVYSMALLPDGKLCIGGIFTALSPNGGAATARSYIARINADGSLDSGFDAGADSWIVNMTVQPDGKLLVAGKFSVINGVARNFIARLNGDGTLDAGFDPRIASAFLSFVLLQPDGKILLGGGFNTLYPNGTSTPVYRDNVARLNEDGTVDESFTAATNGVLSSMTLQADGKILLAGDFTTVRPTGSSTYVTANYLTRLNGDGTLDAGFGGSTEYTVDSVGLQEDGRVLLGGQFIGVYSDGGQLVPRITFARLLNAPAFQTLSATGSAVSWTRGGTAPEVANVTFDLSVDGGSTWTSLGAAAHVPGGWQHTGLSLPNTGLVRARGRTYCGNWCGSSGLIEKVIPLNPSSNARLAGLTLSGVTLTPAFAPDTLAYSATVPNGTSSLAFAATKEDATAIVSGNVSPKALVVGGNTLSIMVTAQDGTTTRTYTVAITRQTAAETSVSTWAAGLGVPAGYRGLLDDPDGDGVANLLEFAFGTGPLNAGGGSLSFSGNGVSPGQPIVASETAGNVTTRRALFVRRTDHAAAGIAYTVSFSAGLVTWEASAVTPTLLADDGTYQVVSVPFPATVSGGEARFFKVGVSAAP